MSFMVETQKTLQVSNVDDYLLTWLEAFLIDRKAGGVALETLRFYRQKIKLFSNYCDALTVKQISQITPSFLRQYLLYLEESGHNAGGRHAHFDCSGLSSFGMRTRWSHKAGQIPFVRWKLRRFQLNHWSQ
jgi:hypothetical protein